MENDTELEDNDFDINGIFPTCTDVFDWNIHAIRRQDMANNFTQLCSNFYNNEMPGKHSTAFSQVCRVLGLYLNHIQVNVEVSKKKDWCKLFYYKLKKDIIEKYPLEKYPGAKEYYQKMTEIYNRKFETRISNICLKYFVNIDKDTYKTLEYLFEIYNCINVFKSNIKRTTENMRKFKGFIEKLEGHPYKYKKQLKGELEKILNICDAYIREWAADKDFAKHASDLLTRKNWIEKRKSKLEELDKETLIRHGTDDAKNLEIEQPKVMDTPDLMRHVTDDVTNNGISIGTVFITFSILIIMFILYKYTTYFSFLQPNVRKLKRKLNKNNKNNLDIMYPFDVEQKNLIDDRYKIAYS
ncbi:variable surface protein [Plasmodium gonderi]|uniref:Variable surface protein n=1 Tax=Plasmodium gonderi TaxID=77519 RepID=A0A1Y1JNV9_PLAGO|nr:variable surface protein [Plasmodium gonderi]GAW84149.1 variable surface protein [Plasmodium gonderi]